MTITEVRDAYNDLRNRALDNLRTADGVDDMSGADYGAKVDFIWGLWAAWDERLEALAPDSIPAYVEELTETIRDPDLTSDAVEEWLDAYPSAVVAATSVEWSA